MNLRLFKNKGKSAAILVEREFFETAVSDQYCGRDMLLFLKRDVSGSLHRYF